MKSLLELYECHNGKVSDKWSLYLTEYDRHFKSYRELPISLLEIGVQNGGSLEIWSQYFSCAEKFVGCDINPDCAKLNYEDPRIAVIVGDATTPEVKAKILEQSESFDLIIDDGSHTSGDIIKSFAHYFPSLKDGGLFVAEDLHCSYWQEYQGGLHDPYSAMSFFKLLADLVNHEHWGTQQKRAELTKGIANFYSVGLDEELLSGVYSIEFMNSLCVIRKQPSLLNQLGRRVVTGQFALVSSDPSNEVGGHMTPLDQSTNFWSDLISLPGELVKDYQQTLVERDEQIAGLSQSVAERDEQIAGLSQSVAERDNSLQSIYCSTSWRITKPIRVIGRQLKRARFASRMFIPAIKRAGGINKTIYKSIAIFKRDGLMGIRRSFAILASETSVKKPNFDALMDLPPVKRTAQDILLNRILIIAELSIPQCTKYRVTQKHEMLSDLGINSTILSWTDFNSCLNALPLHTTVIFYRTPGYPSVLGLINEAKRLKMTIFWEVDDLIFDRRLLENSRSLQHLNKEVFNGVLEGADLYRKAMLACGSGIASTLGLAGEMRRSGLDLVYVIENGLDVETLKMASLLYKDRLTNTPNQPVRIAYGSGTSTHNVDFEEVANSLIEILERFENVQFILIGTLDLPSIFDRFNKRIVRIPFCSYEEYLRHLSTCDVSIAPLEPTIFNECKSNIKYLEASILGIPSVCSSSAEFSGIIQHGETGFLAANSEEWGKALVELVTDPALRLKIGSAAKTTVLNHYDAETVKTRQIIPAIGSPIRTQKTRVLAVNVFYSPRSFGGATVVAEQVNRLIHESGDYEVYVFTTLPASAGEEYSLRRYEVDGVSVIAVILPEQTDNRLDYDNPAVSSIFRDVLASIKPDIVHLHSIQGIGVGVADECVEQKIPYVITLHDAWWICSRQFMIDKAGRYCAQRKIDLSVCESCVSNHSLVKQRQKRLRLTLEGAEYLLAPSRFFADLYEDNGIHPDKIMLNKNGVKRPVLPIRKQRNKRLRFGYVGGNTAIKGIDLVLKVFSTLKRDDIELVVVDNTLNLGVSSFAKDLFAGIPNVTLVPAYKQNTIDSFFSEIDVLLFPTRCKESFGLTVREALARSVWVISTDAGGAIEDIRPGENGIIIPLEDQGDNLREAILKSVERLSNSTSLETVSSKITFFDDQSSEIIKIYKNILDSSKS